MRGPVEKYLLQEIEDKGCIHLALVDPEKTAPLECARMAQSAVEGGSSAVMVGGSTLGSQIQLETAISEIKKRVKVPIILFPNGPMGVTAKADAVWFMSLLNSDNPYYFIEAQMLAAPYIKRAGLEAIPMGYIIAGEGCVAGYVGHARPISFKHPQLAVGYGLAAEALGMRFLYLEAGSGAPQPIPPEMVRMVSKSIGIPLIVGGGIRTPEAAREASEAGASIIVTGTLVEDGGEVRSRVAEIVAAAKR